MSKSKLRSTVTKKLLKNFSSKSAKSVADASRKVTQSGKVKQCLVVSDVAMDAMKKGFEAGINRDLQVRGRDYQNFVKLRLLKLSEIFNPDENDVGAQLFGELVAKSKLKWGSTIIYLPFAFRTIKQKIHEINEEYAKGLESTGNDGKVKYSRRAFGKATHLDHGAEGVSSGLMGSVVGAMATRARANRDDELTDDSFKTVFDNNLDAILAEQFGGVLASEAGKIKLEIENLMANWDQFIDKNGNLKADFSMILTPVLAKENLQQAAIEKMIQQAFLAAFEMTWEGITFEEVKGSSSLIEKFEKHIVYDKFLAKLAKMPGVTVTTAIKKNTKLKTKTKVTEKGKKPKGTKVKYWGRSGKRASGTGNSQANRQAKNSQKSLFSIMAMINQKLPQTVERNMGVPRLESQTGRFAQSVRITEATTTDQGYPSFGYTYQKSPYQVYESGQGRAPWADGHRDPRQLIDASIRELAAHLALGRFYTRRV